MDDRVSLNEGSPQSPEESRPAVYLGRTANQDLAAVGDQDYVISEDGYVGFRVQALAKLVLDSPDSMVWIKPLVVEVDSPAAEQDDDRQPRPVALAGGAVVVDETQRELRVEGEIVELSKKQFDLLEYLLRNSARVIPRQEIIMACWGTQYISSRTVDVHMGHIRRKLGDYSSLIITKREIGYMLKDIPAEPPETTDKKT